MLLAAAAAPGAGPRGPRDIALRARHLTGLLNARLVARPLTPGDIIKYGLPSGTGKPSASGISNTVAIGTPLYLEVEVNSAIPASNILSVTWSLTNLPLGSAAVVDQQPPGHECPGL